jgi:hypothetical protein
MDWMQRLRALRDAQGDLQRAEVRSLCYLLGEDLGELTLGEGDEAHTRDGYVLCHGPALMVFTWSGAPAARAALLRALDRHGWGSMPQPRPPLDAPREVYDDCDWALGFEEAHSQWWDIKATYAFLDDGEALAGYADFKGCDAADLCFWSWHAPRQITLTLASGQRLRFERAPGACAQTSPDPAAHSCRQDAWTVTLPDGARLALPRYEAVLQGLRLWE